MLLHYSGFHFISWRVPSDDGVFLKHLQVPTVLYMFLIFYPGFASVNLSSSSSSFVYVKSAQFRWSIANNHSLTVQNNTGLFLCRSPSLGQLQQKINFALLERSPARFVCEVAIKCDSGLVSANKN